MSRILAVWEMGANLGHIDRLLVTARALRARGHEVRFLLRDLSRAHGRVAAEGFAMGQAPVWLPRLAHPPRLGNFAGVLAAAGWLDAPGLAGLLAGWRDAFALARPDAVLCDHAPTALLALRGTGITTWVLGDSFVLPPPGLHFPPLLDDPQEPARCAAYDATVLAPTNCALALLGDPPLSRLTDLFVPPHKALLSLPELAHFDGYLAGTEWVGPSYAGDVGAEPLWPQGDGPRVFAYLDPAHAEFNKTMVALKALNVRALVHAKGLAPEAAQRLSGPRLRFEPAPLLMDRTVAGADVVLSHASLGTATAAALAGKPQLLLPSQPEQALVARRLVQSGLALQVVLGRAGVDVQALLARLLHEPAFADAARTLAARHAGANPQRTAERLAALVQATL